jgi:hypothetical protein
MKAQVIAGVLLAVLAAGEYVCWRALRMLPASLAKLTTLVMQLANMCLQR